MRYYIFSNQDNVFSDGIAETLILPSEQVYENIFSESFQNKYGEYIRKAQQTFKGKKDKMGLPIELHAIRMASALDILNYDEDHIVTAIYHDVLEDSVDNPNKIMTTVYIKVTTALYQLTRNPEDTYFEYIEKIKGEKKKRQNTQKSLKGMVIDAYQQTEALPKYSTFNPLKILSSASVDVIDENKIPKEYWKEKVVYVLDKKKMLEHLKKGKTIAGADLKRSPYVKGLK